MLSRNYKELDIFQQKGRLFDVPLSKLLNHFVVIHKVALGELLRRFHYCERWDGICFTALMIGFNATWIESADFHFTRNSWTPFCFEYISVKNDLVVDLDPRYSTWVMYYISKFALFLSLAYNFCYCCCSIVACSNKISLKCPHKLCMSFMRRYFVTNSHTWVDAFHAVTRTKEHKMRSIISEIESVYERFAN